MSAAEGQALATPGPWRWAGNVDTGDPYLAAWKPGWGRIEVLGHVPVERKESDRALQSYLGDYVEADDRQNAIDDYLFDRYGEPRSDSRLCFLSRIGDGLGFLEPLRDYAVYEVCKSATTRDDPRVYRGDVVGIRNDDCEFIARSRELVTALLAEIDRLRAATEAKP